MKKVENHFINPFIIYQGKRLSFILALFGKGMYEKGSFGETCHIFLKFNYLLEITTLLAHKST